MEKTQALAACVFCFGMSYSISDLAKILGRPHQGDGNQLLTRVSSWEDADNSALIFLEISGKRITLPERVPAACIMAPPAVVRSGWNAILSDTPKLHFARAAQLLQPRPLGKGFHHATSVVSPEAVIGRNVDIGPYVTVAAGAFIGDGCILHAGVVVGESCSLGEQCILHPAVVLYDRVELGHRVTLHAGAVLGGDGFGYVSDGKRQEKFPQVGRVVIEEDVEIGCHTTIDRGSLGTT